MLLTGGGEATVKVHSFLLKPNRNVMHRVE